MKTFRLPDLGEGLQQAEVSEWHVAENDDVAVDQPLLSVETEKALVEIPSPRSGKIKRLLAKTGDLLPVGAALVEFVDGADAPEAGTVVGRLDTGAAPVRDAARE
jgi:pyruvate dehydrogenase E2 component (dihydrolipoamide acetyltransferase)